MIQERFLSKNDFRSEFLKVEKQLGETAIAQSKIEKKAKENVTLVKAVKSQMKDKANIGQVQQVNDKLKNFASLKDLQELYGKVVPQLSIFEGSMQEFEKGHLQFKQMLSRYDEVMAQKSNKTSLLALEKKCKDKFAKKDELEQQQNDFEEKYTE